MCVIIITFAPREIEYIIRIMRKSILTAALMAAISVSADVKDTPADVNLADSSRVYDLDEVVVVAQPKEQFRLRVQPVSSSMFSSEEIASVGARDLRELAAYVP
jgi:hypothetical protein